MSAISAAMIMAAGLGTRMGALTRNTPKPMLHLGGRPMLDHTLDHVVQAGLTRAVINLHYLGAQIEAHLSKKTEPEIRVSHEQPEILDTGGGIVQALPMLGAAPFCVLNSDAVFIGPNPVSVLLQHWQNTDADALLLMIPTTDTIGYTRQGDFFLDGPIPRRRGNSAAAPFVYTGGQILRPEVFAGAPQGAFSTNVIWDKLLNAGRLEAVIYPGKWVDVGTPEGLAQAEAALAAECE